MVAIYPFRALRPAREESAYVPSVPYDVVTREEAAAVIARNRKSFLRVIRSDAELMHLSPYADEVYDRARAVFSEMQDQGLFARDDSESFSIYQVEHQGLVYTGLVACIGTEEYLKKTVKRHELTRYDKEEDRTRHIDSVNANTGQVFLLYRDPGGISGFIRSLATGDPVAETEAENGSVHRIYAVNDPDAIQQIRGHFSDINALYIADGHHRAKSAVNVYLKRKEHGVLTTGASRFMGVLFAHDSVTIHGYSRLLRSLNGMTPDAFLAALEAQFRVKKSSSVDTSKTDIPVAGGRAERHVFHLYIEGAFYELSRDIDPGADPIARLDVSLLQESVLSPLLEIHDPRGDERLDFMGGAQPIADLVAAVDSGEYAAAILMQPIEILDICDIADDDKIMPPKSTWFEPKLLSGLVIHPLD
ncbi:MAG: DUF1015 domain-containing protein [Methanocalculus sp. MSAO_Arc1]|uniref:DUF1015 domain-containing protein n=1 Tax=Methanocalculus TaxID=71151 RepID=UPI000FF37F04|nr:MULTISPECIES: DUF1015 family protein [unclassified Methanocalculus]MCP1661676.1 uncharacterized protein (DUF1015 family) [Methanocalculus sp. AMF5]RQD81420.1 MAG: DUF1015 domain-containing protein [Methanocalculus sp. MSAO_Arc1]